MGRMTVRKVLGKAVDAMSPAPLPRPCGGLTSGAPGPAQVRSYCAALGCGRPVTDSRPAPQSNYRRDPAEPPGRDRGREVSRTGGRTGTRRLHRG